MTQCNCAACRRDVPPVPPSDRYMAAFDARVRAILGKPAVPALDSLPADVQVFVRRL